jgi:hypothetical protein
MLLIALALLVGMLYTQPATADTLDFSCGAGTCTGTVVQSGSNFSSSGIGLAASFESDPFSLVFDTSQLGNSGSIELLETENNVTFVDFVGTITGFTSSASGSLTLLNLSANWFPLPSDVTGPDGYTPFSSVITLSVGDPTLAAYSVDVPIQTPEPAVPVLSCAGLLGLGLLLKRKGAVLASPSALQQ